MCVCVYVLIGSTPGDATMVHSFEKLLASERFLGPVWGSMAILDWGGGAEV